MKGQALREFMYTTLAILLILGTLFIGGTLYASFQSEEEPGTALGTERLDEAITNLLQQDGYAYEFIAFTVSNNRFVTGKDTQWDDNAKVGEDLASLNFDRVIDYSKYQPRCIARACICTWENHGLDKDDFTEPPLQDCFVYDEDIEFLGNPKLKQNLGVRKPGSQFEYLIMSDVPPTEVFVEKREVGGKNIIYITPVKLKGFDITTQIDNRIQSNE